MFKYILDTPDGRKMEFGTLIWARRNWLSLLLVCAAYMLAAYFINEEFYVLRIALLVIGWLPTFAAIGLFGDWLLKCSLAIMLWPWYIYISACKVKDL